MRNASWLLGVLGIVSSVATVSAQSTPSELISYSTRVAILATAGGEVRCETCAMIDHVTGGMIHKFYLSESEAYAVAQRSDTKKDVTVLASAKRRSGLADDVGGRACGGVSDCHEEWRVGDCHQQCSGGSEVQLAERVEGAVQSLDLGALQRELLQGNGKVRLNLERSAVQVIGCNDTVAYHIPLATRLVADLGAWLHTAARAE